MASRNELPGARPQLQVSYAPLTSKWVGAVGIGVLVTALAASPLVSWKNPFAGPFDDALDAMGKALGNDGSAFGRCVTKASTSEWKIKTPDGEQTFPDLRTQSMITTYAGDIDCIPEDRRCNPEDGASTHCDKNTLNLLKIEFKKITEALKHCPKGACSVTWPQQQTLSIP